MHTAQTLVSGYSSMRQYVLEVTNFSKMPKDVQAVKTSNIATKQNTNN